MPSISVIIPIYNAASSLANCLDSIIQQDFTDYEVVLIDDGSTDESSTICKDFCQRDSRFRYYRQENGGVSKARNTGLTLTTGQWICFSDADDTLPPSALSTLWKLYADDGVELTMGSYALVGEPEKKRRGEKTFELRLDNVGCANLMFLTHEYGYQGYLWNKLFKAIIIREHNLHFNESFHFNEDRLFCIEYISAMKGACVFTSQTVYEYHRNSSSVIGQARQRFNPNIMDDYESSLIILNTLKLKGFPRRTINLARDRIIDSYDLIRHNLRATQFSEAQSMTRALRKRVTHDTGYSFYICNRIRRFFSKQASHLAGKEIYIEAFL